MYSSVGTADRSIKDVDHREDVRQGTSEHNLGRARYRTYQESGVQESVVKRVSLGKLLCRMSFHDRERDKRGYQQADCCRCNWTSGILYDDTSSDPHEGELDPQPILIPAPVEVTVRRKYSSIEEAYKGLHFPEKWATESYPLWKVREHNNYMWELARQGVLESCTCGQPDPDHLGSALCLGGRAVGREGQNKARQLLEDCWDDVRDAYHGHDLGPITYALEAIVEQDLGDWLEIQRIQHELKELEAQR